MKINSTLYMCLVCLSAIVTMASFSMHIEAKSNQSVTFNETQSAGSGPPLRIIEPTIPSPSWTAPHLVSTKNAEPKTIWVKGTGWLEISTVTLTVTAIGDPLNRSIPADIVLTLDNSGSMSGTPINDLIIAVDYFIDLTMSGDRLAIYCFGPGAGTDPVPRLLLDWTWMDMAGKTTAKAQVATLASDCAYNTPVWDTFHDAIQKAQSEHLVSNTPVVIGLTDGGNNVNNYGIVEPQAPWPPYDNDGNPADDWIAAPSIGGLCEAPVMTFTIGLGSIYIEDQLREIAESSNPQGFYRFAPDGPELVKIYENISLHLTRKTAAVNPSPTESMIKDVLPPYIEYVPGSWQITPNNDVASVVFMGYSLGQGGLWELGWNVPQFNISETFEVTYKIRSNRTGWQSIGVTSANSTLYGSDYCKVKYLNWRYQDTHDSSDIWCNETNDVSILVRAYVYEQAYQDYVPPEHGPGPGIPVEQPINVLTTGWLEIPCGIGQTTPMLNSMVQPQLMLNTLLQPMMNPVNMPTFVGLVAALGMMDKIRVKRKMRAMRLAVRDDQGETLKLGIGE